MLAWDVEKVYNIRSTSRKLADSIITKRSNAMNLNILGCHGPYAAKPGEATSGYLATFGNTRFVMDLGAGTLSRLLNEVTPDKIDGIFLSHLHYDHTSDMLTLKYALENTPVVIDVYVAEQNTNWYLELLNSKNFNIVPIATETAYKCGEFTLEFCKVIHPVDSYAVKVKGDKTLFYTGDTVYFDGLVKAAEGSDVILADCAKPDDFRGPHMVKRDALKLARLTGAKLIVTHIAPGYDAKALYADTPEAEIAEEGKVFEI